MQALRRTIVLACVLTLAAAAQASAAPAYVQGAQSSASGTSLTFGYPSSVGAGDLLVGMFRTASTTAVSDSANGSWTKAVGASDGVNSLWYREGSRAGADTITVTSGSSGSVRAVAGDYSGVAASGSLDGTACNTGTSSAVTTGSTASVAAGELAFAGVGMFDSPITATAASPATLRSQFTGSFGTSADEDLTTAAGSQNLGFSLSSAPSGGWAACVATFRPAAIVDTTPPTVPADLQAMPGNAQASLSWAASTDPDSAVAGYYVYRDGTQVANVTSAGYTDTGLTNGTSYSYTVAAYDPAGNVSAQSSAVTVTPQAGSALAFDGTFSSPAPGSNYPSSYPSTSCLSYIASDQLAYNLTSCGQTREDECTSTGCGTASGPWLYQKGVSYCTTVPVYTPGPKLTSGGWYQVAEMKPSSPDLGGGSWTFNLGDGDANVSVGFTDGTYYNNSNAWEGAPATAGWHSWSICADDSSTVYGIWYDGVRQTFNIGHCAGAQTCTGLNLMSGQSGAGNLTAQPLDINAYTGNTTVFNIVHGDPLVTTCAGDQCFSPPEPPGGWNSP